MKPVLAHGSIRDLLMVVFDTVNEKKSEQEKSKKSKKTKKTLALEQELQHTKENLQTTIEELETANEELKSTNEELQSTNEELQSTNEELETSKEELQSLNEESTTVNVELQNRIDALSAANDDMKNLMDATLIGTIFLDIDLRIRRFTKTVTSLIPLTNTDIGRPINHFATKFKQFNIVEYATKVLDDLAIREAMAESCDHKFFRTRIIPYRTINNVINGVVITFEDVTEFKNLSVKASRLAAVVEESTDAMTIQDQNGNITYWNKGAEKMYGFTRQQALGMNIGDIVPKNKSQETLLFLNRAFNGEIINSFETERLDIKGKILRVWLTVTLLRDENDHINGIATMERNLAQYPQPDLGK